MAKPFTKKGWIRFTIIAGVIDFIQFLIDFTGVGEIVNEILDIVIGIVFGLIYFYKKAITFSAFIALLFSFGGEEASAAAAPLWCLDVAYTMMKSEVGNDPAEFIVKSITEAVGERLSSNRGHLNVSGVRQPRNPDQKPLNISVNGTGMRPPSLPPSASA